MCFFFSFCLLFKKTNKNTNQKNEKQKPQAKTKPDGFSSMATSKKVKLRV